MAYCDDFRRKEAAVFGAKGELHKRRNTGGKCNKAFLHRVTHVAVKCGKPHLGSAYLSAVVPLVSVATEAQDAYIIPVLLRGRRAIHTQAINTPPWLSPISASEKSRTPKDQE